MNKFVITFIVLITAGLSLIPADRRVKTAQENTDSTIVITIAAVGDLMCHSVQYNYARTDSGTFDFNPFFKDITPYLSSADFTFGNLETVLAGKSKGYSGYPFFNSPDEYADALKDAGFDLLTTANNHSLDKGEKGLLRTIEILIDKEIHYNGTFNSQSDRDSIRLFNIRGIQIAFLAYTYGTNGIPVPKNKPFLINLIERNRIESDIKTARSAGADIILVHFHFGEEYKREPDKYQKEIVKYTVEAGADIIIGGHPHVIQPVDYFKTNNISLDSGVIAYSLGNFFSNQRWRYSDAGVVFYISIKKNIYSGELSITKSEFLPTWVFKGNREYRILPRTEPDAYDFLNQHDTHKMLQAFDDTRKIITKYYSGIRLKVSP